MASDGTGVEERSAKEEIEYTSYSTSCETVIPNPISPSTESPTIFHRS
jgi:hypothetical protein